MNYIKIATLIIALLSYDSMLGMENLSLEQEALQKQQEDSMMKDLLLHLSDLGKKYTQTSQPLKPSIHEKKPHNKRNNRKRKSKINSVYLIKKHKSS